MREVLGETKPGAAAAAAVRRLLVGPHRPDADPPVRPWSGRWSTSAPGRGGDLVHDPHNLRLKLYDLAAADARDPGVDLWRSGMEGNPDLYTKLIVYARPGDHMTWVTGGYLHEGVIAGFFPDGIDAHVWAAFGDERRSDAPRDGEHDRTVGLAAAKDPVAPTLADGFSCRRASAADAAAVSELMTAVFPDYPTPVTPATIERQITTGSHLFRIVEAPGGELAAAASAEIDHARRNAELTDCATRPDQRGRGHMAHLLQRLETDLVDDLDIRDLYTLARADEVGMNCVFGKLGYVWTGRLVNNCRMPNGWESMNVWCKRAGAPG